MKFNKWTVGLAALGVVSLSSVAQAEETASVVSSVSSTMLSGYVDTSMQWNLGSGDTHAPAYKYGGAAKADGFNLDVIKLTLEKSLDESEWAAGYKVDTLFGPDANTFGSSSTGFNGSDFNIKQAYVALRAPVGNGLDFKVGVFDSIVGYESTEAINNPNFTRSWAHTFEPSTHTGVLATYRVNNMIAFSGGIADTMGAGINARTGSGPALFGQPNESSKTYMGSLALTAPDNWGFASGSTLYVGAIEGFNNAAGRQQEIYYVGGTIATPVTGLKAGASYDYTRAGNPLNAAFPLGNTTLGAHSFAVYASYAATEKLSLHGRLEYADISPYAAAAAQGAGVGIPSSVLSATATVQYDLWKNVLSRLEMRWDHALDGTHSFGGTSAGHFEGSHFVTGTQRDSFIVAANVIYKF